MVTRPPRAADHLLPALLDRLTDRSHDDGTAPRAAAAMNRAGLRKAILRDLAWLLNAVQPLPREQAQAHPRAAQTVLNFGLPPLAGELASRVDVAMLERAIFDAIVNFEPRVLPGTLSVRALQFSNALEAHNVIEFEIQAEAWAKPTPLDLLLRTRLDLEGGQVEVREVAHSALAEARR